MCYFLAIVIKYPIKEFHDNNLRPYLVYLMLKRICFFFLLIPSVRFLPRPGRNQRSRPSPDV